MKQTVYLNSGDEIDVEIDLCPFCGGEPEISHIGNNYTKGQKIEIKCPDCLVKRTIGVIRQSIDWCVAKSLEKWNARSPVPESTKD